MLLSERFTLFSLHLCSIVDLFVDPLVGLLSLTLVAVRCQLIVVRSLIPHVFDSPLLSVVLPPLSAAVHCPTQQGVTNAGTSGHDKGQRSLAAERFPAYRARAAHGRAQDKKAGKTISPPPFSTFLFRLISEKFQENFRFARNLSSQQGGSLACVRPPGVLRQCIELSSRAEHHPAKTRRLARA